jgi:ABC-type multidrug transport system fused ATPase/permease subunit
MVEPARAVGHLRRGGLVAMFLLDWRLAVFSLALVPVFVLLTRRVGEQRRLIRTDRQKTMADISTLVEESLSVSGILLGKTMGRSRELTDRFERESSELASLEVRQTMAGRSTSLSASPSGSTSTPDRASSTWTADRGARPSACRRPRARVSQASTSSRKASLPRRARSRRPRQFRTGRRRRPAAVRGGELRRHPLH